MPAREPTRLERTLKKVRKNAIWRRSIRGTVLVRQPLRNGKGTNPEEFAAALPAVSRWPFRVLTRGGFLPRIGARTSASRKRAKEWDHQIELILR